MDKEYPRITIEEWVKGIFGWPEGPEPWYYDINNQGPDTDPKEGVAYLRKLFAGCGELLGGFSNKQLKDGFWYILDPSDSNEIFCLLDKAIPLKDRLETINAMADVFRDCFSRRCSNYLSHIDESRENPLNMVCYMWWDICPLFANMGKLAHEEVNLACLKVMETALSLDNQACQESALHGLGHAALYYPAEVKKIVDAFISSKPDLRPELLRYANSARAGTVQ